MKRIIPAAAAAFAIVSTGVAVAFAATMPTPSVSTPSPAPLVPQTPATATTTATTAWSAASDAAPTTTRPGVQRNAVPAAPAVTPGATTTPVQLPVACVYPQVGPEPMNPTDPVAPLRTPAPTPTVTAVTPPDTCPPYVAYP